ncbi:MFS transporter [Acinetobacter sp. SA01]|uniref:MFS transporter n=1 Tax=Acinetobacter sp. SA01 TaxID=1862567 RepID=UPI00196ADBC0|nr:MFS transporter [Acinetobacter sp. SA01]
MHIQTFLDQQKWSGFQTLIFIMMFLVAFFDGMDTAVMGYIAPDLIHDWQISKADIIPVLSAALIGAAIGAIVLGPLADRFGRRALLLVSVFIFSIGCVLSSFAINLTQLEILRFITGLGLGAALPNAVTLLSEYCPAHKRAFIVNTMYCGFPIGAAVGGFAAAYIIPHFGWESMLLISGVIPFLLCICMLFLLPESVRYLLLKNTNDQRIPQILGKINASAREQQFELENSSSNISMLQAMRTVFSSKYAVGTLSLWICFFSGLMIFYSIVNWMPVLFKEVGMPPHLGPIVSGLFALGGIGAMLNGWLMDRFNGNYVIAVCTFFTAVCVALLGTAIHWSLLIFIVLMISAGTLQNTAQSSLPVLAAKFYPTEARTTGVSWMCGIGRFGAVVGTLCMGYMANNNMAWTQIFTVLAIPAVVMTVCMLIKNIAENEAKDRNTSTDFAKE